MKRKIKVGILHSLSGTMSFSESPLVDATLMAIDEINQSGGVLGAKVVPMVEDCASKAEIYAQTTARLIKKNQIDHFFGCWTSASRKAVKPLMEAHDAFLWYPVQNEGLEASPNIVYTGNCLNQQIEPAVKWAIQHLGKTCYLVGSDYVFPRTANELIRALCKRYGVQVLGESYQPLGAENFERTVNDIISLKPAVVFNTINGDSNLAFFYYLGRAGNKPEQIPVMAFSIGEVELKDIGLSVIGHYACCGYFQCLDNEENLAFIQRFKQRYGSTRVVSDPVVSAYIQPFLWKRLAEKTGGFNVADMKGYIAGIGYKGPSGTIEIQSNHHAARPALIGKVNADLQFDLVWQHRGWIEPLPWLGLENQDLAAKEMIKGALAAYPEKLDFSAKLRVETEKRKQAEHELKKEKTSLKDSHTKYKALFTAIGAGVVLVDIETGGIHDCNAGFEALMGKSRAVLIKQCIWEQAPPDEWDAARRIFSQLKKVGEGKSGHVIFFRPDGQKIRLQYKNAVIKVNGKLMLQSILSRAD